MDYWREVWQRKGTLDTRDLKELDGFEATSVDPSAVAAAITAALSIGPDDLVLELGCGAGMLAKHLACRYLGLDYSPTLLGKHREILGGTLCNAEAENVPFATKSVDFCFAFSVFHYFPDREYARRAIEEMKRVARHGIFVGDLPTESHRAEHLLFDENDFAGWRLEAGFYTPHRFNASLQY